ncbi:MAG TPA: lipoprotein [Coxiellaceae bacterium]|nr:lipoprotein [Coxiellaceae bacterium]
MKIIIIILSALILSSCGQYGSLYLPNSKNTTTQSKSQ